MSEPAARKVMAMSTGVKFSELLVRLLRQDFSTVSSRLRNIGGAWYDEISVDAAEYEQWLEDAGERMQWR